MRKKIFSILAGVMMIALILAGTVYARASTDLEVEGWVEDIDLDYLIVEGVRYEIVDESEVDEEIALGDWVKVKYYVDEGILIILEVEIEDEDEDYMDDEDMDDDDMAPNPICSSDLVHPALWKLAESYEVEYGMLLPYFCEQGFGVGEIKLALRTAELEDVDEMFEEILMRRSTDGMKDVGWGEIWQELGLIGKGKQEMEEEENQASKNKEKFQFEGEEEQFENKDKNKDKNKENNGNKPSNPPGRSKNNPGKGKGPGN